MHCTGRGFSWLCAECLFTPECRCALGLRKCLVAASGASPRVRVDRISHPPQVTDRSEEEGATLQGFPVAAPAHRAWITLCFPERKGDNSRQKSLTDSRCSLLAPTMVHCTTPLSLCRVLDLCRFLELPWKHFCHCLCQSHPCLYTDPHDTQIYIFDIYISILYISIYQTYIWYNTDMTPPVKDIGHRRPRGGTEPWENEVDLIGEKNPLPLHDTLSLRVDFGGQIHRGWSHVRGG